MTSTLTVPARLKQLKADLQHLANPQKAKILASFFKTGPGQYGEGDIFLGITVPKQRLVAKRYGNLSLADLSKLINSKIHEHRLVALLILVDKFQNAETQTAKDQIYKFYLSHTKNINNWDLVDLSAPKIVGPYLRERSKTILFKLARSKNLWERRIAILATFNYIYRKDPSLLLRLAKLMLKDKHDLIHKAVGWMLREVGKRCGEKYLTDFLDEYAAVMPRTMLRYSIERLSPKLKQHYLLIK